MILKSEPKHDDGENFDDDDDDDDEYGSDTSQKANTPRKKALWV